MIRRAVLRSPVRLAAATAVVWIAASGFVPPTLSAVPASGPAAGARATVGSDGAGGKTAGARKSKKARKRATFSQPRIAAEPRFQPILDPDSIATGEHLVITVRLLGGDGAARHASFHVGADPARLRYLSFKPTGRGVLHVAPGGEGGEIVVYRSSLPEGFATSEDLVEMEFVALAPGPLNVALTDVRLMDERLRDLSHVDEAASLVID